MNNKGSSAGGYYLYRTSYVETQVFHQPRKRRQPAIQRRLNIRCIKVLLIHSPPERVATQQRMDTDTATSRKIKHAVHQRSVPAALETLACCEYAAESRTMTGVPASALRLMASGTSTKETNVLTMEASDRAEMQLKRHPLNETSSLKYRAALS